MSFLHSLFASSIYSLRPSNLAGPSAESAVGSLADMATTPRDVRFAPKADIGYVFMSPRPSKYRNFSTSRALLIPTGRRHRREDATLRVN